MPLVALRADRFATIGQARPGAGAKVQFAETGPGVTTLQATAAAPNLLHRAARALLTVLAALLAGVGWVAFTAAAGVWVALSWCRAALVVGWVEARDARARR